MAGPTTYSDRYVSETSVVRIHSGNGLHEEMDQRAIACFDQALEDAGLVSNEQLRRVLHDYFAWATTTTMARYHNSAEDGREMTLKPSTDYTDYKKEDLKNFDSPYIRLSDL